MMLCDDMLRLRALEPADIDVLFEWENMDELWDTSAILAPYSHRNMAAYIRDYDADPFHSGELRLMAECPDTRMPVGYVELYDVDVRHRRASVGVFIAPRLKRKGYGMHALTLLERYCSGHLILHQLFAIIPAYNDASLGLFRKAGFRLVATLPDYIASANVSQPYTDATLMHKILVPHQN